MKTLDEVIKAWSICFSDISRSNCTGCPYADEDGESACFNHDREDALHYLKMYRSDQIQWEADRENWRDKWETYIEAREMHIDAVKELKRNDPLSWEQLKQMTGKPVWVEYNLHISDRDARSRMWIIVQKIMPWRQDDELIYYSGFVFGKKEIGKTWQAYRKERS